MYEWGIYMKILFSDMDGTIVDREGILHKKDCEMMHVLQDKGHKIVFNTGRNHQEALFVIEKYRFPFDYLVLNNGAHIVDKQGNELFKKTIPGDVGKAIIDYCLKKEELWIFFYTGSRTIGYFEGKTFEHIDHEIIEVQDIDFISEYQKMDSFDIIALNQDNCEIEMLLKVQKFIATTFDKQAASCLNTQYLDITAAGCTKGTGVLALKESLKATESYCIGDSYNDLSMFEVANHAYTFHHVGENIAKHTEKQVHYVHELISDMLD